MVTALDKALKREITVDGEPYVVAMDPDGLRLTGKGKRRPAVELRWRDLLSGDAAMAVALNASLLRESRRPAAAPARREPAAPERAPSRARKKPQR